MITCSTNVGNDVCGEPAAEVLLVMRESGNGIWWEGRGRCKAHPAADWLPVIRRYDPSAQVVILPVPGELGTPP